MCQQCLFFHIMSSCPSGPSGYGVNTHNGMDRYPERGVSRTLTRFTCASQRGTMLITYRSTLIGCPTPATDSSSETRIIVEAKDVEFLDDRGRRILDGTRIVDLWLGHGHRRSRLC